MELLANSTAGLEIETCLYYTNYNLQNYVISKLDTIQAFYNHLTQKGLDINTLTPNTKNTNWAKWQLIFGSNIKCPNDSKETETNICEDNIVFPKDYKIKLNNQDFLNYAPVEIVSSLYDFSNIHQLSNTINTCLHTPDFAYSFNSSQGINYYISNSRINNVNTEVERTAYIHRLLVLMWVLEPMFISLLPKYRQRDIQNGLYCNSLHKVFGSIDNMNNNWRRFFTNQHPEWPVNNGLGKSFIPNNTILSIENITFANTQNVFFKFKLGSISMNPNLMNAWIIMLSVLVASTLDNNAYTHITNTNDLSPSEQKNQFRLILQEFGMVQETLGVIENLQTGDEPYFHP